MSVQYCICQCKPGHKHHPEAPQQSFSIILWRKILSHLQLFGHLFPKEGSYRTDLKIATSLFLCVQRKATSFTESIRVHWVFIPLSNVFHMLIMSCVNNVLNIPFLHLRSTGFYIDRIKRYLRLSYTLLFRALYLPIISYLLLLYSSKLHNIRFPVSFQYHSLNMLCISETHSVSSLCFCDINEKELKHHPVGKIHYKSIADNGF